MGRFIKILFFINLPLIMVPVYSYGRYYFLCSTESSVEVYQQIELDGLYFDDHWKDKVKIRKMGAAGKSLYLIGDEEYVYNREYGSLLFGIASIYVMVKSSNEERIFAEGKIYNISPFKFPLGEYLYRWLPRRTCGLIEEAGSVSDHSIVLKEIFKNKMELM